jgi:hypothetical protein
VVVGDLVQDVVSSLANQIAAKEQNLTVAVPDDLPEVKLDRDRIIQVLTNLVSNANKYTPEGGSIGISARIDGPMLVLAVRDTGYGISEADLEKLFETRFFRANNPNVQFVSGTGLGLQPVEEARPVPGTALLTGGTGPLVLPSEPATSNGHRLGDTALLDGLDDLGAGATVEELEAAAQTLFDREAAQAAREAEAVDNLDDIDAGRR